MNSILEQSKVGQKAPGIITSTTQEKGTMSLWKLIPRQIPSPTLNVTENQAVTLIKEYLKEKGCRWQCGEPSNHQYNTAERSIQTYKNHFISRLALTDKS